MRFDSGEFDFRRNQSSGTAVVVTRLEWQVGMKACLHAGMLAL